jgi:HK97 gp10 family phage protein
VARVDVNTSAVRSLADDADMKRMLQRIGDDIARDAAAAAPKRSGAMAASIHAEVDEDDGTAVVRVSFDADHFYGLFAEVGTSRIPARPFLRPALTKKRSI